MRTSDALLALLREFEGLRLAPYLCASGKPTVGYGSTRGVRLDGRPITRAEAERRLLADARTAGEAVDRHVRVPLGRHQRDALASFVFNVGEGNFARSTLLKRLNARQYPEAADQLLRWAKVRDPRTGELVELPGLARRRQAERALFLSPPSTEA